MASPEMTLLQFVALTLPAVAILLQAILRYRDKHLDESSASSYETEFLLLEIGFGTLILGGMLFAYEIYDSVNSFVTELGIIAVSVSLIVVGFATLLALRRPKYISQNKSLEEELKDRGVKYGVFIALIASILLIGSTLSNAIELRLSDASSLIVVGGYLLFSFLIGWAGSLFLDYYGFQKGKEQVNNWEKEKEAIARSTLQLASRLQMACEESGSVFPPQETVEELGEDWKRILDSMPKNKTLQNHIRDIIIEISHISSLLNEREKNIHGIGEYQSDIRNLMTRLQGLREEYRNEINKEEAETLSEDIEELEQEIRSKRGEREQQREEIEDKIRESTKGLKTTVKEIV